MISSAIKLTSATLNTLYYKHNKCKDVQAIKLNFVRKKKDPLPSKQRARKKVRREKTVRFECQPNPASSYQEEGV
jgi:hypothetical protein